jgi:hypothetical protein
MLRSLFYPFFALLTLLGLLTAGCEEEVFEPQIDDLLERYYPLELNRPVVYTVDSIVLTNTVNGVVYDTAHLFAREILVDTFTGADGQLMYRGERYDRRTEAEPYVFRQTFTVTEEGGRILRNEDNLTFVKLVQPIRQGTRWDPHVFFDVSRDIEVGGELLDVYNYWSARYIETPDSVMLPAVVNADSVITVQLADETDNAVEYRLAYERYAAGIGLIERFVDARYTQCNVCCGGFGGQCSTTSWDEKAEKGYIIHQSFLREE